MSGSRTVGGRIGYLNTRYPALSHTFIYDEIHALRDLGVDVRTFSIRKPSAAEFGEGADLSEIESTVYIGHSRTRVALLGLAGMLRRPIRAVKLAWRALREAPGGVRAKTKHLVYALQAVVLVRACRKQGVESLHVHMANNGAMVALLATVFDPRLSYSLTIHGPADFFDVERLRLRSKASEALFVRCISNFCRSQVMSFTAPDIWDRLHVVHCGINLDTFKFKSPEEREGQDRFNILSVGRLAPVKGLSLLLSALARLDPVAIPWRLTVIGDGPERGRLVEQVDRDDLNEHVEFAGPMPPAMVRDRLRTSRLLVVASFAEGVPMVLMEAMASGTEVLATRVGGIAELIESGETGTLIHAGSVEALESAVRRVLSDPADRLRAQAARRVVEQGFERVGVARELRRLFQRYGQVSR